MHLTPPYGPSYYYDCLQVILCSQRKQPFLENIQRTPVQVLAPSTSLSCCCWLIGVWLSRYKLIIKQWRTYLTTWLWSRLADTHNAYQDPMVYWAGEAGQIFWMCQFWQVWKNMTWNVKLACVFKLALKIVNYYMK